MTLSRFVPPSVADPPFGLPAWTTVIDLPMPPSVNDFVRKLGNKSPRVVAWTKEADACFLEQRGALVRIVGPFEVEFVWNRLQRGLRDCDNSIKPCMDWLQRVKLIENDRLCERLVAYWGTIPLGCRVRLRSWHV